MPMGGYRVPLQHHIASRRHTPYVASGRPLERGLETQGRRVDPARSTPPPTRREPHESAQFARTTGACCAGTDECDTVTTPLRRARTWSQPPFPVRAALNGDDTVSNDQQLKPRRKPDE
jgi:hypothetical protein